MKMRAMNVVKKMEKDLPMFHGNRGKKYVFRKEIILYVYL